MNEPLTVGQPLKPHEIGLNTMQLWSDIYYTKKAIYGRKKISIDAFIEMIKREFKILENGIQTNNLEE